MKGQTLLRNFRVLLVGPLLLVVGCSDDGLLSLYAQRQHWESTKTANYDIRLREYSYSNLGAGPPPLMQVRNGRIVGFVRDIGPAAEGEVDKRVDVPALFAIAEDAYKNADSVRVEFDEQYGFPRRVEIDEVKGAVDDEITYQVTEFRAVAP